MLKKLPIISLFFTLAITILNFVFGLYFLKITGSAFIFGTLIIIGPLVSLFLTPIMSSIVDSHNRKKILIASQNIALSSLLIYEVFRFQGKLLPAYILMIAIRVAEELFTVTTKASVPQLVDGQHYQKLNALIQSGISLANILGPIIGGIAFALVNIRILVYLTIVFVSISIIISHYLVFNNSNIVNQEEKHTFKDVVSYLRADLPIFYLVIIAMFVNFFSASITIGLPIIVLKQLHLSNIVYSFLESFISVAMVVIGIILTVQPVKNELPSIYKFMVSFAFLLFFFGLPSLIDGNTGLVITFLAILVFLFGIILICANTTMTTYLQKHTPIKMQGGIYSIINALSQLFVPIGSLCYGSLFDIFNPSVIFILSGIILLIIIAALLILNSRYTHTNIGGKI